MTREVHRIMNNKNDFLCPRYSYRGAVKPQWLVFDANLQEFSQRVSYLSALTTGGKLTPEESYRAIESLWRELSASHEQLGVDR